MAPPIAPTELLRPGLLAGLTVAFTGPGRPGVAEGCAALGATVTELAIADPLDEDAAGTAARGAGAVDVLVCDLRGTTAGAEGFHDVLEPTWAAVRAVANAAMIPEARGGKMVFLAPGPGAGDAAFAGGLRAALENMARTLSIEWARFGIRLVAILPGPESGDAEVPALVAYLASPAGDYFSGCVLETR